MKSSISLLIVGIIITSCSYKFVSFKNDSKDNTKMYNLSGVIYLSNIHLGGAGEHKTIYPLQNLELLVVRITDTTLVPTIVTKITTNSEGEFRIKLPNGNYGFINMEDEKDLKNGQYLPAATSFNARDSMEITTITWEIKPNGPIQIKNKNIMDVIITSHKRFICYDCP